MMRGKFHGAMAAAVAVGSSSASTWKPARCDADPKASANANRIRERTVQFEGMKNVRDLGGLGKMPRGILYRADDPLHATPADKEKAVNVLKLRTVIDLRADLEVDRGFSDFGAPQRVLCDLPPDGKKNLRTTGLKIQKGYTEGPAGMAKSNEIFLEIGVPSLARAFRTLAQPGALPALFHCSLGKDRTGLLAMMLLSLAGASDEDIAADFTLTQENTPCTPSAISRVQNFMKALGIDVSDEEARHLLAAEPATATLTLEMIRRNYGSVESYLRKQLELTEDEIAALKKAILKDTLLQNLMIASAGILVLGFLARSMS